MRLKMLCGLGLAAVLSVAAVAVAGGFTKPPVAVVAAEQPVATATPPCCPDCSGCCPECVACCAIDGCCEECVLCCIEMGCDPSCCLPTAEAKPKTCKPADGCASGSCCK